MLMTLTSDFTPATDLGYLLHKHPGSVFSKSLSFGKATVFYPEASDSRCTAALAVEIDPIELVRGRGASIDHYVNDRPYTVNSLFSVALGECFRTAMNGVCQQRPDLVDTPLPLRVRLIPIHCDAGDDFIRRLLEPLGYAVAIVPVETEGIDECPVFQVEISAVVQLKSLLAHLYVLIPVLDNHKHYYVGGEEIEKLVRRGEGWLETHPEQDLIARRYLRYQRGLVRTALERIRLEEGVASDGEKAEEEAAVERPIRLSDLRQQAILTEIRELSPKAESVLDLGCGEGRLIAALLREKGLQRITGADVSPLALDRAAQTLRMDRLSEWQKKRIQLIQASALYSDERFRGYDVIVLSEVIEHVELPRLPALERALLGVSQPTCLLVTTPNAEFNSVWETLPAGRFRHRDHRFEWTRAEFANWASTVAGLYGYRVRFSGIGEEDDLRGCPTQMAVFDRIGG